MQHSHHLGDRIQFTVEQNNLVIERDFLCAQTTGVSVFKRYISEQLTCIEIDVWGEKQPVESRFLRLMIAAYVKYHRAVTGFITRSTKFCHFLFNIAYGTVDGLFQADIARVRQKKSALMDTLNGYRRVNPTPSYKFRDDLDITWPSGDSGKRETPNQRLIDEGLTILNQP